MEVSAYASSVARPAVRGPMIREIVEAVASGEKDAEVLRRRSDCLVVRLKHADESVVVKLWDRRGLRALVRNLSRTGNRNREWGTLERLTSKGLEVPRPLHHFRLKRRDGPFTEALVMQDLGDCTRAVNHLKELLSDGRDAERSVFDGAVIDMTHALVNDCGILDVDHHLNNIVVQPNGRIARIDFELARRVFWPRLFTASYAQMLAAIVFSYVIAAQPSVEPARAFAAALYRRLEPSAGIRASVDEIIRRRLESQREEVGVEVSW